MSIKELRRTGELERMWAAALPVPPLPLELDAERRLRETSRARLVPRRWQLYLVWILLILSLLPWRKGVYYSGGMDPTVIAKAGLSVLALALGSDAVIRCRERIALGHRTLTLLTVYIVVTMFGAAANGGLFASTVLAVRLFIVVAAVYCVMVAFPMQDVLRAAVSSMAVIGVVSAATDISSATQGRLSGGLIPVQANQMAMLFAPPAIWLIWRLVNGSTRISQVAALICLVGLTWVTGSRTGFLALLVAAIIILLYAPKLPIGGFLALVTMVPALFYLVFMTSTVSGFVSRDGTGNVATFNSRTIAWSAAFSAPGDFWRHWFGGGLAVKTVAVSGQYWNSQVLDSSWVSSYVQAGALGMIAMGLYGLTALIAAFRSARGLRALLVASIVYALITSVTESGLLDSYVLLVVMLIPTLATESRQGIIAADVGRVEDLDRRSTPDITALSSASSPRMSTTAT